MVIRVVALNGGNVRLGFETPFLRASDDEVYALLASPHGYTLAPEQFSAWRLQLPVLCAALADFAARSLYARHTVHDITRSDAGAVNLAVTTAAAERIIAGARERRRKAIVFVTGVPGAGKTLVGLNVATRHDEGQVTHRAAI